MRTRTLAALAPLALLCLAAPVAAQTVTPEALDSLYSARAVLVNSRGFIRAADTRYTAGIDALDRAIALVESVVGPPVIGVPVEPPPEPDPVEPPADLVPLPPVALDSTVTPPELPRDSVDVSMPALSGRVLTVAAGDDLQSAIDSARAGDVVELQAGASWQGPVTLRARSDSGYVIIRSSRWAELPEGVRVGPADADKMARIAGGQANRRTVQTAPGAAGWRLIGLEIALDTTGLPALVNTIVELGQKGQTLATMPSRIILDRTYIHGTQTQSMQRCVILNSARSAIIDSYLDDCHARGFDSQAIGGWSGTGPYLIQNNYLAGAAENIMFGGAKVGPEGIPPSDIIIRGNRIIKPLSWKGVWTVKNLLELKIAERVLIEDNLFENVWAGAQVGFAINLKSENRNKAEYPDLATRDVTVRNNRIVNARFGASIIGGASTATNTGTGRTSRVLIERNTFEFDPEEQYPRAFQYNALVQDLAIIGNSARRGRVYDGNKYLADVSNALYAHLAGNDFGGSE